MTGIEEMRLILDAKNTRQRFVREWFAALFASRRTKVTTAQA